MRATTISICAVLSLALLGCGSNSSVQGGSGGSLATGGSGRPSTGGVPGSGGTVVPGSTATGGETGTGGASKGAGGSSAQGGTAGSSAAGAGGAAGGMVGGSGGGPAGAGGSTGPVTGGRTGADAGAGTGGGGTTGTGGSTTVSHRYLKSGCNSQSVAIVAADGHVEWEYPIADETGDSWLLPNGNVIFSFSSRFKQSPRWSSPGALPCTRTRFRQWGRFRSM